MTGPETHRDELGSAVLIQGSGRRQGAPQTRVRTAFRAPHACHWGRAPFDAEPPSPGNTNGAKTVTVTADRTFGEYGCSKVKCDGFTDAKQCRATITGQFRKGIRSARAEAATHGWRVAVRTQYTPNGFDLRDYCPEHVHTPGTPTQVPNTPKTPIRAVCVPDEMWDAAKAKAAARGEDRRIPELEAAIKRLTGISTNGDMPRYLDARARMTVAEARIAAVEKLCAAKDRIDASSCDPDGGGWATTDEIRAALAEPS